MHEFSEIAGKCLLIFRNKIHVEHTLRRSVPSVIKYSSVHFVLVLEKHRPLHSISTLFWLGNLGLREHNCFYYQHCSMWRLTVRCWCIASWQHNLIIQSFESLNMKLESQNYFVFKWQDLLSWIVQYLQLNNCNPPDMISYLSKEKMILFYTICL